MSLGKKSTFARRVGASGIDFSIEFFGGALGAYFGIIVAALLTALKDEPPTAMQTSIWHGFGFGFLFWAVSVSFINRVLIQGVSRASLGKKYFKLELSSEKDLTWAGVFTRWACGYISLLVGGLGYTYALFDSENRTFHDRLTNTKVVFVRNQSQAWVNQAAFQSANVTMLRPKVPILSSVSETVSVHEFTERMTAAEISKIIILSNQHSERPGATVIQLPIKARVASSENKTAVEGNLAQIIEMQNESKRAA
jgi:hypothetical protein